MGFTSVQVDGLLPTLDELALSKAKTFLATGRRAQIGDPMEDVRSYFRSPRYDDRFVADEKWFNDAIAVPLSIILSPKLQMDSNLLKQVLNTMFCYETSASRAVIAKGKRGKPLGAFQFTSSEYGVLPVLETALKSAFIPGDPESEIKFATKYFTDNYNQAPYDANLNVSPKYKANVQDFARIAREVIKPETYPEQFRPAIKMLTAHRAGYALPKSKTEEWLRNELSEIPQKRIPTLILKLTRNY